MDRGSRILFAVLIATLMWGCAATPGREQPFGYVVSTAFSPDGQRIAAATSEGEVAIFDARPLWFRRVLTRESDKVAIQRNYREVVASAYRPRPLAFSADGKRLAARDVAGHVVVWNVETGVEQLRLAMGAGNGDVVFMPDGQTLITTGPGVAQWSASHGTRVGEFVLPADAKAVTAAVSPDGRIVLAGLASGEIAVFDAGSRALLHTLKAHQAPVSGIAFHPDGVSFASTAGGYDLRLWERSPTGEFEKGALPEAVVAGASNSLDSAQGAGLLLWLLGTIRGIQIVGAPTLGAPPFVAGAETQFQKAAHTTPFLCGSRVAFSADGRYLASTANLLKCEDCLGTLAPAFLLFVTELATGATATARDLGCEVSISPDGSVFAVGGPGAPGIRDARTGQALPQAPASQ